MHCRALSSPSGLYALDANSTTPSSCDNQKFLQTLLAPSSAEAWDFFVI